MNRGPVVITNLGCEIGATLAREMCTRGYAVAGLAYREEDLDATAEVAGPLFTGLVCDRAKPDAVERAFAEVRTRFGPVRVLVNCPPAAPRGDILHETVHSFMSSMNQSLGGVVACTREALSDMVTAGEGRILTICRPAAIKPASVIGIVSQEAIRAYSQALFADLADRFLSIVVSTWVPSILDGRTVVPGSDELDRAGRWGATLAVSRQGALNGTTWVDDQEVRPQRSIRRWAGDWLNGQRSIPWSIARLEAASEFMLVGPSPG